MSKVETDTSAAPFNNHANITAYFLLLANQSEY